MSLVHNLNINNELFQLGTVHYLKQTTSDWKYISDTITELEEGLVVILDTFPPSSSSMVNLSIITANNAMLSAPVVVAPGVPLQENNRPNIPKPMLVYSSGEWCLMEHPCPHYIGTADISNMSNGELRVYCDGLAVYDGVRITVCSPGGFNAGYDMLLSSMSINDWRNFNVISPSGDNPHQSHLLNDEYDFILMGETAYILGSTNEVQIRKPCCLLPVVSSVIAEIP